MSSNLYELKIRLKKREKLFAGWISFDHPAISEIFSMIGLDFLGIDMEHAPISLSSAQSLIARSQANGTPCLPRPVSHSNDFFKPLLDSGADGLIVQMVNNKSDVDRIVNCLKYPPIGQRTYGVNRAHGYGLNFEKYLKDWNDTSILIVQVESKEAIENIEEIISNKNVDGVMIGPYDLSGSYGYPGNVDHPLVLDACKKVIDSCFRHNKSCGTQISKVDKSSINRLFECGYSYIILSSDLFILKNWSLDIKDLITTYK